MAHEIVGLTGNVRDTMVTYECVTTRRRLTQTLEEEYGYSFTCKGCKEVVQVRLVELP